ncbi:hypothetical protein E4U60_002882 [Claviceps pazoutovae]|uniref:PIPK domain-containing protein n=1 Tax=Claviceps pazoutovae TaxID=1649127 RepID=A0A9P7SGH8_9HYPO|nr:hypothetical protein E4U60_002882 [Claviceps pazoutovae]
MSEFPKGPHSSSSEVRSRFAGQVCLQKKLAPSDHDGVPCNLFMSMGTIRILSITSAEGLNEEIGPAFLALVTITNLVITTLNSERLNGGGIEPVQRRCIMAEALFHDLPSVNVIAKMLGFFQIIIKSPSTGIDIKLDLLITENLFYDRSPTCIFDLKGSMRNRKIQSTGEQNEVLLDENMVDTFTNRRSSRGSIPRNYLERRTYTWDKKLDSWIVDRGFAGGGRNRPTVTSPKEYKSRFRVAMAKYILQAQNCWHFATGSIIPSFRRAMGALDSRSPRLR